MKMQLLCWLVGFRRVGLVLCLVWLPLLAAPKAAGSTCLMDTADGSLSDYYISWDARAGCNCSAHLWMEYGPTTSYGTTVALADPAFTLFVREVTGNLYLYPIEAPYPDTFTRIWHWRMGITNCMGTNYSADHPFLTLGKPVLDDQPQSQTVLAGGSVTFNVSVLSADYANPVVYQWLTNGVPIPGALFTNNTSSTYGGVGDPVPAGNSYTVTNAGPDLNGVTFSVQVANHFNGGSPWQQSTGAVLTVSVPQPPVMQAKLSGGNVVLSWPASAAGFGLETRVGVGPGMWAGAGGTVVTNGSTVSVALPASDAMRLFRLRHP